MKGTIMYESKYNTTKDYASWISEETGFSSAHIGKVDTASLADYDIIIIGSPVMAHQPKLSKWIEKNWNLLNDKKVYLFTSSGAPSSDKGLVKGFEQSLPREIHEKISYFPMSGRLIFSKLTVMDKIFMKLGQMMEKDPVVKEEMVKDVDGVKRDEIFPLLKDINTYIEQNKKAS